MTNVNVNVYYVRSVFVSCYRVTLHGSVLIDSYFFFLPYKRLPIKLNGHRWHLMRSIGVCESVLNKRPSMSGAICRGLWLFFSSLASCFFNVYNIKMESPAKRKRINRTEKSRTFFTFISEENGKQIYECTLCNRNVNGTKASNLTSHLKTHPEKYVDVCSENSSIEH